MELHIDMWILALLFIDDFTDVYMNLVSWNVCGSGVFVSSERSNESSIKAGRLSQLVLSEARLITSLYALSVTDITQW